MYGVISNPSSASFIAGSINSLHFIEPNLWCTDHSPATVPGTPLARYPRVDLLSITVPFSSRYMFVVDSRGAFSR